MPTKRLAAKKGHTALRTARCSAVGTLSRGLELLRLVNQIYPASVGDLHAASGLPKATVSRLLRTIGMAGYIVQDPHNLTYSPSAKLQLLSAGVALDEWVSSVAAPIINRLSQQIQWPSDLATLDGRGMTIRYTTRTTAPITVSEAFNVSGLSMLQSDFGRAFLAFASDDQRDRILAALVRAEQPSGNAANDMHEIGKVLKEIRAAGYAVRGKPYSFVRASTIAVPIVVQGHAAAAINVICRTRFIPPSEIPKRFLKPLRAAAIEIASKLRHDGFIVCAKNYSAAVSGTELHGKSFQ